MTVIMFSHTGADTSTPRAVKTPTPSTGSPTSLHEGWSKLASCIMHQAHVGEAHTSTLIHSCFVVWTCIILIEITLLSTSKIDLLEGSCFYVLLVRHSECACALLLQFMPIFLSILQWPTVTLPQLISFKTRSGNVLEQLGSCYRAIGILLLNDTTGTVTQAIIQRHNNDATNILLDIFQLWITGKGRLPIKWTTFADVLRNVGLSELANEMVWSLGN